MSEIEAKLDAMGLVLPEPIKLPQGIVRPFSWVRSRGNYAYVSGHIALNPDGSVAEPLGKVGAAVTLEQGYEAARLTGAAILASLKRELGYLDRIAAWLRVFGMVNSAPDFDRFPLVINGFSELTLELARKEVVIPVPPLVWPDCRSARRSRSRRRSKCRARLTIAAGGQ